MSGIVKPLPGAQLNLDHPLAQGLVGCWLMNEGSGKNVHDYSGQNNEGTLVGFSDPPIATSGWNPGPHGGALAFDPASNNYVHIPVGRIPTSGNFTLLMLFAVPVTSVVNSVAFCQAGAAFALYVDTSYGAATRQIRLYVGTEVCVGSDIRDGLFHQVSVTREGNVYTVRKDTVVDCSGTTANNPASGAARIGTRTDITAGLLFSGLISSSSIYNRALSAEEIADLYAFPYCMFDEPAYPAWMRKHISAQDYYRHLLAGSGY